jgi:hypothetical protein
MFLPFMREGGNVTMMRAVMLKDSPSVLILKLVTKQQEFGDGLLRGCDVYVNHKSPYINLVLFLKLFWERFTLRKLSEKCLPILDDHASHCSTFELLELADS